MSHLCDGFLALPESIAGPLAVVVARAALRWPFSPRVRTRFLGHLMSSRLLPQLALMALPKDQVSFAIRADAHYAHVLGLSEGVLLRELVSVDRFVEVIREVIGDVPDGPSREVLLHGADEVGRRFQLPPGELRRLLTAGDSR